MTRRRKSRFVTTVGKPYTAKQLDEIYEKYKDEPTWGEEQLAKAIRSDMELWLYEAYNADEIDFKQMEALMRRLADKFTDQYICTRGWQAVEEAHAEDTN
jgi:hypothetical protein